GPNYGADSVAAAGELLAKAGLRPSVMVDCSHANSGKEPARQPDVARAIAEQLASGSRAVFGVMLESFLVGGRQDVVAGRPLVYGQSITDAGMGWDATVEVLGVLADGIRRGASK